MEDFEEEPKLKYTRWSTSLREILEQDSISCFSVSDRFISIGTHGGTVYLTDLIGTPVKEWKLHKASVYQICFDDQDEFVASAGTDGNVIVCSLYSTDQSTHYYKRPVTGIGLEPGYSKKSSRQIVFGGMAETLLLSGRGWFGHSVTILDQGNGPIYAISWKYNYIVWANIKGVHIMDSTNCTTFGHIEKDSGPRPDIFRCNIVWKTGTEFLIGWADSVKVVHVLERTSMDIASGLSAKYIQVTHQFRTEFVICGLAPFNNDLMLLAYDVNMEDYLDVDNLQPKSPTKRGSRKPPEIHIVDLEGEEIANDLLSIPGYDLFQANDYRLEYLHSGIEVSYYIVSPKEVVIAKPRDSKDHVNWLVQCKRFEEALKLVEDNNTDYAERLKEEAIATIGIEYLESLFLEKKFEIAALNCSRILKQDKSLWEKWIYKFADNRQLKLIYSYIPTESPVLSHVIYELILTEFLHEDYDILLEIVRIWPSNIYTINSLIMAVEQQLQFSEQSEQLWWILLELCNRDLQFDKSVYYGIILKLPDQAALLQKHNLINFAQSNVALLLKYLRDTTPSVSIENTNTVDFPKSLIEVSKSQGVQYLLQHIDHIPPSKVIQELENERELQFVYLLALFEKDPAEFHEFHNAMVTLFADYHVDGLLDFLRSSSSYSYPDAFNLCEERDLIPEMMYLLGKMGDNRKALWLIIERLGDVNMAIEFAKEQNDSSLWEEFLVYAMDKPNFIVGLLKNLSFYINPLIVIDKIPMGLDIPGLKDALIQIMTDCSIQLSLRNGCEKILKSDTWETLLQLIQTRKRGIKVSPDILCSKCGLGFELDSLDHVVLFFCHHYYHSNCVNADIIYSSIPNDVDAIHLQERAIDSIYARKKEVDPIVTQFLKSQSCFLQTSSLTCPCCQEVTEE